MAVIAKLAAFVAEAQAAALPAIDRERLRLHVADTAVAALAGARIAEGRALVGFADTRSLPDAIGGTAAAIRLTEIDDIHLPSCTTPSSAVVPVALALAGEAKSFESERVASAIWVGVELMTRLGEAVRGPEVLYRGVWPTYLAAPVGAAATAARMCGLDPDQTGHALSLAMMLTAGGVGRIHGAPSGRWFLFAKAVSAGTAAALAARNGYCGDPALLDSSWFADTHGFALDTARLTAGLGEGSVFPRLSLKPFCSAKQSVAAVEAFQALLVSGVPAASVTRVRVRVPLAYAGMIATRAEAGARQSTLVSVAHQIALAACAPAGLFDIDRTGAFDPAAVSFPAKVEVIADRELAAFYPRHWPAAVEIEAGGRTLQSRIVEAHGDPERPLGEREIDIKAHKVLDPLVGAAAAAEWLQLCHGALAEEAAGRKLAHAFARGLHEQ